MEKNYVYGHDSLDGRNAERIMDEADNFQERAKFMFGMFATARKMLINSLPKDLSPKEFKKQIYERTYGEPLPDDFFKDKN